MRNAQWIRSNQIIGLVTVNWIKVEKPLAFISKSPAAEVINLAGFRREMCQRNRAPRGKMRLRIRAQMVLARLNCHGKIRVVLVRANPFSIHADSGGNTRAEA